MEGVEWKVGKEIKYERDKRRKTGVKKTIRQKLLLVKFQCHLCEAKCVPAGYVVRKEVNTVTLYKLLATVNAGFPGYVTTPSKVIQNNCAFVICNIWYKSLISSPSSAHFIEANGVTGNWMWA